MSGIIEMVNVTRPAAWLPWAVQYFFLIGLSVAAFGLSLPGLGFRLAGWMQASRLALLAALTCGLTAPVALLADLHQPGRFWEFYTGPNLHSWMAWGSFFILGYLGGLLAYTWTVLRPDLAATAGAGTIARLYRWLGCGSARDVWLRRAAHDMDGGLRLPGPAVHRHGSDGGARAAAVEHAAAAGAVRADRARRRDAALSLVLDLFYRRLRIAAWPACCRGWLAVVLLAALGVGAVWLAIGLFDPGSAAVRRWRSLRTIEPGNSLPFGPGSRPDCRRCWC